MVTTLINDYLTLTSVVLGLNPPHDNIVEMTVKSKPCLVLTPTPYNVIILTKASD